MTGSTRAITIITCNGRSGFSAQIVARDRDDIFPFDFSSDSNVYGVEVAHGNLIELHSLAVRLAMTRVTFALYLTKLQYATTARTRARAASARVGSSRH